LTRTEPPSTHAHRHPSISAGGLEEQVTTAILHAAFIPFGPIKDVDIPQDHQTQKNRGFGFVTFEETCVRPESHQPYVNQSNLLAKSFGSRPHPVLTSRPFTPAPLTTHSILTFRHIMN